MIVVTDTSVILNLCLLRQENLLVSLFGEVLAPMEVVSEFGRLAALLLPPHFPFQDQALKHMPRSFFVPTGDNGDSEG